MKRIIILTCEKAGRVCTGAGCFDAFYNRTKQFERYEKEDAQILAFMKCNGCGCFP